MQTSLGPRPHRQAPDRAVTASDALTPLTRPRVTNMAATMQTCTDYELERQARIAENRKRMGEPGGRNAGAQLCLACRACMQRGSHAEARLMHSDTAPLAPRHRLAQRRLAS